MIILGCENVHWIQLAKNRAQWCAVVITVMKLWVPLKVRNFLTEWILSYYEGLCFKELVS